MREKVAEVIEGLKTLHEDLGQLADAKDRLSRTNAVIGASEKQLAQLRSEIASARTQLEGQKEAAMKSYEKDIYAKQCELRDLTDQLAAIKDELAVAFADRTKAIAEHAKMMDEINKYRKSVA